MILCFMLVSFIPCPLHAKCMLGKRSTCFNTSSDRSSAISALRWITLLKSKRRGSTLFVIRTSLEFEIVVFVSGCEVGVKYFSKCFLMAGNSLTRTQNPLIPLDKSHRANLLHTWLLIRVCFHQNSSTRKKYSQEGQVNLI